MEIMGCLGQLHPFSFFLNNGICPVQGYNIFAASTKLYFSELQLIEFTRVLT